MSECADAVISSLAAPDTTCTLYFHSASTAPRAKCLTSNHIGGQFHQADSGTAAILQTHIHPVRVSGAQIRDVSHAWLQAGEGRQGEGARGVLVEECLAWGAAAGGPTLVAGTRTRPPGCR